MTDFERLSELPEHIQSSARARLGAVDRLRAGMKGMQNAEESETDQQLDDDTVTLRGLSDEALEYITATYDVEVL